MKIYRFMILLLILGLFSSCMPVRVTTMPTNIVTQAPIPTLILPTLPAAPEKTATATLAASFTPSPSLAHTATPLPSPSLVPEQAREVIQALLREPDDCSAPCFWGIVPGKTSLGEAKNTLVYLGIRLRKTTLNNKDYYGFRVQFDSDLSIGVTLTVVNETVMGLKIDVEPEKQKPGVLREWLAYSPETLIQRYGSPSRVELWLGRGSLTPLGIYFYFDELDTIIEYWIFDLGSNMRICPLRDQFESVKLWMGSDLYYPPSPGEPLEKITSLTLDEFSELMMGEPDKACFDIDFDLFP